MDSIQGAPDLTRQEDIFDVEDDLPARGTVAWICFGLTVIIVLFNVFIQGYSLVNFFSYASERGVLASFFDRITVVDIIYIFTSVTGLILFCAKRRVGWYLLTVVACYSVTLISRNTIYKLMFRDQYVLELFSVLPLAIDLVLLFALINRAVRSLYRVSLKEMIVLVLLTSFITLVYLHLLPYFLKK